LFLLSLSQNKEFDEALKELQKDFEHQKNHPLRGSNKYMAGITGHNMAILYALSDQSDQALSLFRQALSLKRTAFGDDHPIVAVSLCYGVLILMSLFSRSLSHTPRKL
jgi:tetratricopeptide (TPR) repeat protein